jgi:hypothetical protein
MRLISFPLVTKHNIPVEDDGEKYQETRWRSVFFFLCRFLREAVKIFSTEVCPWLQILPFPRCELDICYRLQIPFPSDINAFVILRCQ